jgi:tetratricopeptide (TPR) repeat protein
MAHPRKLESPEEYCDSLLQRELERDVREICRCSLRNEQYKMLHEFVQMIASFIPRTDQPPGALWCTDEKYGERLLNLAIISEKCGEYSRAVTEATNAIDIFARLEEKAPQGRKKRWLADAKAKRGFLLYRKGENKKAEKDLREALESYESPPWVRITVGMCSKGDIRKVLGYVLCKENKMKEAWTMLEEAQQDYRTEWGGGEKEVNEIQGFLRSHTDFLYRV